MLSVEDMKHPSLKHEIFDHSDRKYAIGDTPEFSKRARLTSKTKGEVVRK